MAIWKKRNISVTRREMKRLGFVFAEMNRAVMAFIPVIRMEMKLSQLPKTGLPTGMFVADAAE